MRRQSEKFCRIGMLLAFLLVLTVFSAGCVTETPAPGPSDDLPPEMAAALQDVTSTLSKTAAQIQADLVVVAGDIAVSPSDTGSVEKILREYAKNNHWVNNIAYCTTSGDIVAVPLPPDESLKALYTSVVEQKFTSADVIRNGVRTTLTDDRLATIFVPVRASDGKYLGFVVVAYDPYYIIGKLLNNHTGMNSYGLWVGITALTTIYSSSPEYTDAEMKWSSPKSLILYGKSTISAFGDEDEIHLVSDAANRSGMANTGDEENAGSVIVDLYSYATSHPKIETLYYISQFKSDNFTLFAYDVSGNVLARSDNRFIGQNQLGLHDAYGTRPVMNMLIRMRQGGGYVHELIPTTNAQAPEVAVPTMLYVLPIDSNWFIGVQTVHGDSPVMVDPNLGFEIMSKAKSIVGYSWVHGKEATIAEINRPDTQFSPGDVDILAVVSMNGDIISDVLHPEMIGTSLFSMVDSHGSSVGRGMVGLARNGGGLFYYCTAGEGVDGDISGLYLMYVQPANEDWFTLVGKRVKTI